MIDRATAVLLDRDDPLAPWRDRFALPPGVRYFAGNSLGAPPRGVGERLARLADAEWGGELVRGWQHWIDLPAAVAARIAPLLGVAAEEVAIADSTTVNLFKLVTALLQARPGRRRLVAIAGLFPSDLYAAQGATAALGRELLVVGEGELREALLGAAALLVSHVDFRTARLYDLAALAALARERGALLLADVSHSVATMPLRLADWGVDLAVSCTYKFLGGGPGSPAALYVRGGLQEALVPALRGWMGHAEPFAFAAGYQPAPGIDRFQCGTPPVLGLIALEAALELFAGVELPLLRRKVEALGELLIAAADQELAGQNVEVASPRLAAARGAHVALRHPEAAALSQALLARGVIGDLRAPDLLRFGLPPLTLRFVEVWEAVAVLRDLLASGAHRAAHFTSPRRVT